MRIILLLVFSLSFTTINAQIAHYNFEENLSDSISGFDAEYIINGDATNLSPSYVSFNSKKAISLNPIQGVKFPLALNDELKKEETLQVEIKFSVDKPDSGEGFNFLLSMLDGHGVNDAGISIATFSQGGEETILLFIYSDGRYDQVPNHPGSIQNVIGRVRFDEPVTISLVMDFEKEEWVTIVNGSRTSNRFFSDDAVLDVQEIKNGAYQNTIYAGWARDLDVGIAGEAGVVTSTTKTDHLSFYSPKKPGNVSVLTSALQGFTNHVDGSVNISESERLEFLRDIFDNYEGNFSNAKDQVLAFITAYEANRDPLFVEPFPVPLGDMDPESQAIIFLQDEIHKKEFVVGNIENLNGLKFESAENFPGKVKEDAPRLMSQVVEINGTHNNPIGYLYANRFDDPKRPTGYYAAPGELVTIKIPENLIDKGINVLVGAHFFDQSQYFAINRSLNVSKNYKLESIETVVANPFGGAIYITVPSGSDLGWFNVEISGAVKSPYFYVKTEKGSNLSQWQSDLADRNVEWVDLESDYYMMTIPTNRGEEFPDPTELMTTWDEMMVAYNYIGGRPVEAINGNYFAIDLAIGGFFPGYPLTMADLYAPHEKGDVEILSSNILKEDFYKSYFLVILHEMGHAEAHPTLPNETETIVNLPAAYIYNTVFEIPLDSAFKYSIDENFTLNEAAMDWMTGFNFRNNENMGCDPEAPTSCRERPYQARGHAKYVEMADLFGWESVHKLNKSYYDKWSTGNYEEATRDGFIRAASEGSNVNMAPLFHFWGDQPSEELINELSDLPKSDAIKDRIEFYKSIIPKNREEYESWYNRLKPGKNPVHHDRYDFALANYETENYASAMKSQIDLVLEKYFSETAVTNEDMLLGVPAEFSLNQNYPNPFNPSTNISFSLPKSEKVTLTIYDMLGRRQVVLINNQSYKAGLHQVSFNASELASGMYFYRLEAGSFLQSKKLMLVK